jgi:hypothetical protein
MDVPDGVGTVWYEPSDTEAARVVAEYPDFIADTAAGAPRETVGPYCSECFVFLTDLTVERSLV